MHKSKHPGTVDPKVFDLGVNNKRGKGTFGPPNGTSKPHPDSYIKKHSGEPVLPDPTIPTLTRTKGKPAVPTREEKPVMGLVSAKNFVTANAVENILSTPKKVIYDAPLATSKPDYGKVPTYLKTVKGQIQHEKQLIEDYHRSAMEESRTGSVRQMTENERGALVLELKLKWQKVNEAYQKLPFTLDTPMRKMKKEKYEEELTQLEKDIETLSRKTVLVATDE